MGREKPKTLPTSSPNLVLAGTLNDFFISKITTIHEDLNSLKSTTAEMSFQNLFSILRSCASPSNTFPEASVEEVTKIICESSRATCSLDPMPTALVKEAFPHLAHFITHIVNLALSSGTFLSKLKSAIVHPLIKKPNLDLESLNNYHPVSNLSFLSTVIEKVIASQTISWKHYSRLTRKLMVQKQHFCVYKMTVHHQSMQEKALLSFVSTYLLLLKLLIMNFFRHSWTSTLDYVDQFPAFFYHICGAVHNVYLLMV